MTAPYEGDMDKIRAEIDRVDQALLDLIAERLDLAAAVRRAKSGVRLWRPSREQSLLRRLADMAGDTPAPLVSRVWAELVSASLVLQGPMRLHVALEGDALEAWSLVRDRFGAALPSLSYPTASSALAAASADEEGVAIVPAPGGMHNWWPALCRHGALSDMHILAGLPRIGRSDWPTAVAVSSADMVSSGHDISLVATKQVLSGEDVVLRSESGDLKLYSLDRFIDESSPAWTALLEKDPEATLIGVIEQALSDG